MAGSQITINVKSELGALQAYLKKLASGELARIHSQVARNASWMVAKMVRAGYQSSSDIRKTGTLEAYAQGKSAGNIPRRKRWPGASSMDRAGMLVSAVTVKKSAAGYVITMDDAKSYASSGKGDPSDAVRGFNASATRIAAQLEEPKSFTLPLTGRMLSYLQLLADGRAGAISRGPRSDADVQYGAVVITPRPRPVWKLVAAKIGTLRGAIAREFLDRFNAELARIGKKLT